MMKKFFLTIFLLLLFLNLNCARKEKKTRETKPEIPPVKTEIVKKTPLENVIESTGIIEPDLSVKVSSKIAGRIEKIYYREGDFVKNGSILLTLDTKELVSQKQQMEAVKSQTEATLKNVEKNYQRMKNLYEEGIVSQQSFEAVETQLEVLKSQLQQTKAGISLIDTQLENSIIKSPVSGKISQRFVEEGEVIAPTVPLFQIVDTDFVKVKIGLSENKIKDVKIGQKVRVFSDTYPGKIFEGNINMVSPTSNPVSRLFDVQLKILNKGDLLKPGMFVKVEIIVKKIEDAIVIPKEAVIDEEDKKFVVLYEKGICRKREVLTGIEKEKVVQILKGLKENEEIIVEGGYGLEDGTRVRREEK